MAHELAVVILAAGAGTRMKSKLPKVLHSLAGRPLIAHALATAEALRPRRIVTVVAPGQDNVAAAVSPHPTAIQDRALGTAHAVRAALPALRGFKGDVLVLYADTPLISPVTLRRLLAVRRRRKAAVAVLGFRPADPAPYGRLVVGRRGALERIVESREASAAERQIGLCNSGVMAVDGRRLASLLAKVGNRNRKREYYLTDLVGHAVSAGHGCAYVEGPAEEFLGINTRVELAAAEQAIQTRLRERAMTAGVTMLDPQTVWLSHDTRLGRDVTLGPGIVFGPGVSIGDDVTIRGFCHIEGARIGVGAVVGPFARLRPGTVIEAGVHIGNFVEVKAARVDAGAKINHLAYVGDASVGARSNIGAGVITVNYDGFGKYRTEIGKDAFVGSNASLIAPVKVGDGAVVGAGSVISRDVPAEALAVTRGEQHIREGAAPRLRARKKARAAALRRPSGGR